MNPIEESSNPAFLFEEPSILSSLRTLQSFLASAKGHSMIKTMISLRDSKAESESLFRFHLVFRLH